MTPPDKESVERAIAMCGLHGLHGTQGLIRALQARVDALEADNTGLRRHRDVSASAMVRNHIRAETLKAERDAGIKEQNRLTKAWEAKHAEQVKSNKSHAEYFDKSQRRMHELVKERDTALSASGAAAAEMRERCAEIVGRHKYHWDDAQAEIRETPLPTDAQAALDRALYWAWNDAIEAAADVLWERTYCSADCGCHDCAVADQYADEIRALKRSWKEGRE